jgi:hypothetical protein
MPMRTRDWSHACGIVVAAAIAAACPRAQEDAPKDAKAAEEAPKPGAPQGSRAPDFSIGDEAGNTVTLAQHRGAKAVLLAFYPMDFTAG